MYYYFGSGTKRTALCGIALTFLATSGCSSAWSYDDTSIHGGSTDHLPRGCLSVLEQEDPVGQVVVIVKFPKPIDVGWLTGFGHSGNGDDSTTWEELSKVRFESDHKQVLTVKWQYSTKTRKIKFGEKEFDLPKGKVAVLGYDIESKPTFELRDNSLKVLEALRKELGDFEGESKPAELDVNPKLAK